MEDLVGAKIITQLASIYSKYTADGLFKAITARLDDR